MESFDFLTCRFDGSAMREVVALAEEWANLADSELMKINNSKYLSLSALQKEKVLCHLRLVRFQPSFNTVFILFESYSRIFLYVVNIENSKSINEYR